MKELFQSGDWAKEKHVPVVEVVENAGESGVKIKVSIGREIPHPNTTAHYIAFVDVYFLPEGGKFPYHVGRVDFASHGASVEGPDTSGVYSVPEAVLAFKTAKGGTVFASSYCNIHGLWESKTDLKV